MSTPNSYITCVANVADSAETVALLADAPLGETRESTGGNLPLDEASFQRIATRPNNDIVVTEREGIVGECMQLTLTPGPESYWHHVRRDRGRMRHSLGTWSGAWQSDDGLGNG